MPNFDLYLKAWGHSHGEGFGSARWSQMVPQKIHRKSRARKGTEILYWEMCHGPSYAIISQILYEPERKIEKVWNHPKEVELYVRGQRRGPLSYNICDFKFCVAIRTIYMEYLLQLVCTQIAHNYIHNVVDAFCPNQTPHCLFLFLSFNDGQSSSKS